MMIEKLSFLGQSEEHHVVQCQVMDNSLYGAAIFLPDTKASFQRGKQKQSKYNSTFNFSKEARVFEMYFPKKETDGV